MISAAAFLLAAGMANAQLASKESTKITPSKPVMTSKVTTPHKSATVTAASGTPSASVQKQTTASTTIKRKHHYKKGDSLKKTVNK